MSDVFQQHRRSLRRRKDAIRASLAWVVSCPHTFSASQPLAPDYASRCLNGCGMTQALWVFRPSL